jgi:hypothetical protein
MLRSDNTCKDKWNRLYSGRTYSKSGRRWIKGYIRKIEICDALYVEIWDIYRVGDEY